MCSQPPALSALSFRGWGFFVAGPPVLARRNPSDSVAQALDSLTSVGDSCRMDATDLPTSRRSAAIAGSTRFIGRPCRYCGSTVRHTSSSQCVACTIARANANNDDLRATLAEAKARK